MGISNAPNSSVREYCAQKGQTCLEKSRDKSCRFV